MKWVVFIVFITSYLTVFSQNNETAGANDIKSQREVLYYYDNAGNRVQRKSIYLNSSETNKNLQVDTLQEQLADKKITVYPNPVEQKLFISIENYEDENGNIYVVSLNGRIIKKVKINSEKTDIDFSNLPTGTYIIKIQLESKTKEYTVIKK